MAIDININNQDKHCCQLQLFNIDMRFLFFISTLFLFAACTNKEELKREIKEELKQEMIESIPKIKKGDGSWFYNEQVCIGSDGGYYIHHSTLNCPAIKNGVQRGFTYTSRQDRNLFCSKCMDDKLINIFNNFYFSNND